MSVHVGSLALMFLLMVLPTRGQDVSIIARRLSKRVESKGVESAPPAAKANGFEHDPIRTAPGRGNSPVFRQKQLTNDERNKRQTISVKRANRRAESKMDLNLDDEDPNKRLLADACILLLVVVVVSVALGYYIKSWLDKGERDPESEDLQTSKPDKSSNDGNAIVRHAMSSDGVLEAGGPAKRRHRVTETSPLLPGLDARDAPQSPQDS